MRRFLHTGLRQLPLPLLGQKLRIKCSVISSQGTILSNLKTKSSRSMSTSTNALIMLIEAVQNQDSNAITRIATEKPRLIAEQTNNDNTALHEAARLGNVEMIEILAKTFSTHFNVNHKCHCYKQRTTLAYAVEGGHEAAVQKLFLLGADPNITDEKRRTALDYAIEGFESGKNTIVFERIISNIVEQGGKANIFLEEAHNIIHRIEEAKKEALKQKAVESFINTYKKQAMIKVKAIQIEYLEEVKKHKNIGPGNK